MPRTSASDTAEMRSPFSAMLRLRLSVWLRWVMKERATRGYPLRSSSGEDEAIFTAACSSAAAKYCSMERTKTSSLASLRTPASPPPPPPASTSGVPVCFTNTYAMTPAGPST